MRFVFLQIVTLISFFICTTLLAAQVITPEKLDAQSPIEGVTPLCQFDDIEGWQPWWSGELGPKQFTLTHDNQGTRFQNPAIAKDFNFAFIAIALRTERSFQSSKQIEMDVELLSGGASILIDIISADGKTKYTLIPRTLENGAQTLAWHFPDDLKPASPSDTLPGKFHIHRICVRQKRGSEPLDLRLKALRVTESRALMDWLNVDVQTGNPLHLWMPDHAEKPALSLTNQSTREIKLAVKIETENWWQQIQTSSETMTIGPQQTQSCALPLPENVRDGVTWIRYEITTPTGTTHKGQTSFCRMTPAGPTTGRAPGFLWSICSHAEQHSPGQAKLEFLAAALCGAKVMRVGEVWPLFQPARDVWDFQKHDELVDLAAAQGMEIQTILGYCPTWAAPANRQANPTLAFRNPPENLEDWRRYVQTVTARYKGKIRLWEMWNEPDLAGIFTAKDHIALQKIMWDEIKKVDSNNIVMTAGFGTLGPHGARKDPQFMSNAVIGSQDYFDVIAYHEHGDFPRFSALIDGPMADIRKQLRQPKKVYFNETAISATGVGEKFQAQTLVKKSLFAFARGGLGYTWYDIRNDGNDPSNYEHNFGMLTNDFHPKAVYAAFNTLTRTLGNMSLTEQLAVGQGNYLFQFKNENENIAAGWIEEHTAATQPLIFSCPNSAAPSVIDMMGNAQSLPVFQGSVLYELSSEPTFLSVKSTSAQLALRGALLQSHATALAIPGRSVPLHATAFNPTDNALTMNITWQLPDVLKTSDVNATEILQLKPGEKRELTFNLPVPAKLRVASAENTSQIQLLYEVKDSPWRGTMNIPWRLAYRIPTGDFSRGPDITLDQYRQVVNLFENLPATSHLTWKGTQDLSANVWFACDATSLRLRVEVTDDVLCQPFSGAQMWKGDSVQIGFLLPRQTSATEIGLSPGTDGKGQTWIFRGNNQGSVDLHVEKIEHGLRYEARIALSDFGLSEQALHEGILMNLLINDNDNDQRKGWIELAPGFGRNKNPQQFPLFVFD